MALVKIGDLYVDVAKCSFALSDFASEGPKIKVFFGDECYHFSLKSQPKEYKALETYLAKVETLESYNLRQLRDEVFDPFLDEDISPIYALYRGLPNANKCFLMLFADGSGRLTDSVGVGLLSWDDLEEALVKLEAYKRDYVISNEKPIPVADYDPYLDLPDYD